MNYNEFDEFDSDILFILKEDKPLSVDNIWEELGLEYQLCRWDKDKKKFIRDETLDTLDLSYHKMDYASDKFFPITTCKDRLLYAYACMHEDTWIDNIVREKVPEIKNINKRPCRTINKYYLQHWMKEYNFTLNDFIFNDKYIILHDAAYSRYNQIDRMVDLGLLNLDNIEACSTRLQEE